MWEIAAIISKEISEKDAKQHFKSMITLGKVEFCMDKFEKATTLKIWEQAPAYFENQDIKHLQNLSSGMITCFN